MTATRPLLSDQDNLSDEDYSFDIAEERVESAKQCNWCRGISIMTGMTAIVGILMFFIARAMLAHSSNVKDYSKEKDPAYWHDIAHSELRKALDNKPTLGQAKNVILFLGDGMGPTSVTAGRILAGQMKGLTGEDHRLSFDKFPYTGLAVTYNVNTQITDSAASATAYTSGVKTNQGMLGVNAKAIKGNCTSMKGTEVDSILRWFLNDGRSAGVVTTTTVTHATPGSTYSHTPHRDWESDTEMPQQAKDEGCKDIARQLVEDNSDINVVMGGGISFFKPHGYEFPHLDPDKERKRGRNDSRDLTQEWQDDKARKSKSFKFVSSKEDFDKVDPTKTDYLLGLFTEFHMAYEIDRDETLEPSLAEMTEKAIKVLQKNEKGFFLMVEGGRIDHGHHKSKPSKALHDVVSFSHAVEKAVGLTDMSDTLILVTADHSHTMSISGYASRGNPILDISNTKDNTNDHLPYTTILYANGPGYQSPRTNVSLVDIKDKEYVSQSGVPMDSETHGGEDVAMYARGPQSYLYSGVHENNYIPILMAYASCVGPYSDKNICAPEMMETGANASPVLQFPHFTVFLFILVLVEFICKQ